MILSNQKMWVSDRPHHYILQMNAPYNINQGKLKIFELLNEKQSNTIESAKTKLKDANLESIIPLLSELELYKIRQSRCEDTSFEELQSRFPDHNDLKLYIKNYLLKMIDKMDNGKYLMHASIDEKDSTIMSFNIALTSPWGG